MTTELKNCPFCQTKDVQLDEDDGWVYVYCNQCEARGSLFNTNIVPHLDYEKLAAEAWNRRV